MSTIFDSSTTAPVVERISDTILERIEAANIVDVSVRRPDREGRNFSPGHHSITLVQLDIGRNDDASYEGNPPVSGFNVTFNLICFVRNQKEYENSYSKACNVIAAEVIRAITNPSSGQELWYQMDGLSTNASIGDQYPLTNEQGAITGVVVPLEITFRVSENNHYEVRA
jgi:hypothetical protein